MRTTVYALIFSMFLSGNVFSVEGDAYYFFSRKGRYFIEATYHPDKNNKVGKLIVFDGTTSPLKIHLNHKMVPVPLKFVHQKLKTAYCVSIDKSCEDVCSGRIEKVYDPLKKHFTDFNFKDIKPLSRCPL